MWASAERDDYTEATEWLRSIIYNFQLRIGAEKKEIEDR